MTSHPFRPTKSFTPPKARPTPSKAQAEQEDRHLTARQVNLQWAAVIIVGLVMLVFGSGTGGNLDQVRVGGHG